MLGRGRRGGGLLDRWLLAALPVSNLYFKICVYFGPFQGDDSGKRPLLGGEAAQIRIFQGGQHKPVVGIIVAESPLADR